MATGIQAYLNEIGSAVYGEEVRSAIINALKQCYKDATGNPDSLADLINTMNNFDSRLKGYESAFAAANEPFKTGSSYVIVGDLMICRGNFVLEQISIKKSNGALFDLNSDYSDRGHLTEYYMEVKTHFPACFTARPSVSCQIRSRVNTSQWITSVNADQGGINRIGFLSTEPIEDTDITIDYIAVGKFSGSNMIGAKVASEGIKYVTGTSGTTSSGLTWGEYFIREYNKIPAVVSASNTQSDDAKWCSEFVNVCAYRAGVDVGKVAYFPYFASAYNGLQRFFDGGKSKVYIRQGNAKDKTAKFCLAKSLTCDKNTFDYTVDKNTTYEPKIGDILFTKQDDDDSVSHCAIVCGCIKSSTQYSIYTIEGNIALYLKEVGSSSYEEEGVSWTELFRTVARRKRDMYAMNGDDEATYGHNVAAVVSVDYPR